MFIGQEVRLCLHTGKDNEAPKPEWFKARVTAVFLNKRVNVEWNDNGTIRPVLNFPVYSGQDQRPTCCYVEM